MAGMLFFGYTTDMYFHQFIGVVAVLLGISGFARYLFDMSRGTTKPHIFSWGVWFLLEGTGFLIQWQSGAGPGSWVMLVSTIGILCVFIYSFRYSKVLVRSVDWVCLVGAVISFVLWYFSKQPLLAAIMLSVTDLFAFLPTFRKTWSQPYEETLLEYGMSALKYAVAFMAFSVFTPAAVLYSLYLVVTNTVFVLFALARRYHLSLNHK